MRDLVRHTGEVHRWATGIVGDARLEAWNAGPDEIVGEWPNDEGLVEWFRSGLMQLDRALSAAPDDLECWTFMSASSPKAFWARRQAHEIAIHRADSEIASGAPPIFESSFAADGLHELLVASLNRRGRGPRAEVQRTLAIEPFDTDDRWVCTIGPGAFETSTGPHSGSADCTIRASANELYLFLWNRIDRKSISVEGNTRLLEVWRDTARI